MTNWAKKQTPEGMADRRTKNTHRDTYHVGRNLLGEITYECSHCAYRFQALSDDDARAQVGHSKGCDGCGVFQAYPDVEGV